MMLKSFEQEVTNMVEDSKESHGRQPKQEADLSQAVKAAREQPGVEDLMAVYDAWAKFDSVMRQHRQLVLRARVVTLSCSSGPAVGQI